MPEAASKCNETLNMVNVVKSTVQILGTYMVLREVHIGQGTGGDTTSSAEPCQSP